MLYDVFICHAYEDKGTFVHPLAEALRDERVEVWYDKFSLKLGDSIRRSLDEGLRQSRFGVVVLSKAFFNKRWPQYELDGLTEKEMRGRDKVILPVWHDVGHADVFRFSPPLANRQAVSSDKGIHRVVQAILDVVRPQASPLIVARDILLEWGVTPPVITDKYWLDVVEASNRVSCTGATVPPESAWNRWSFPLPPKEGGPRLWGERLAWTAMQLKWVSTAETDRICPITRPEKVLRFIADHPGLHETCAMFPELLAEYAPQLTIPTMGGPFEEYFQKLYADSVAGCERLRAERSRCGTATTTTGDCPLCDAKWAMRSPTFGDYEPAHVASEYFIGGMFGPPVSPYEHIEHAVWLLSADSKWLPAKTHEFLIRGMATWHAWVWGSVRLDKGGDWSTNGAFSGALFNAVEGKGFKWTKRVQDDALRRLKMALNTLGLCDTAEDILDKFKSYRFPQAFVADAQKRRRQRELKNPNRGQAGGQQNKSNVRGKPLC